MNEKKYIYKPNFNRIFFNKLYKQISFKQIFQINKIKDKMKQQQQQISNVLIISDSLNQFHCISALLQHYFPSSKSSSIDEANKNKMIFIKNKYYTAEIKLINRLWTEQLQFQPISQHDQYDKFQKIEQNGSTQINNCIQQKQNTKETSYDFIIMLKDAQNDDFIQYQHFDNLIDKYNPQEYVILIDSPNPQNKWKHQQNVMQKCNNFIEIVKENLQSLNKCKPNWTGSLLNQQQEEQFGFFSLLDRMATTKWTNLISNKQSKNKAKSQNDPSKNVDLNQKVQFDISKQQTVNTNVQTVNKLNQKVNSNQQTIKQNHTLQSSQISKKPLNSQPKQVQQDQQQQQNQKSQLELQKQMQMFQSMMGQMMNFKLQAKNMKDQQRRGKAEKLFGQVFKGMMGL